MVMSHIDYANGLLAGVTELVLGMYQRIQSFAAKVVLNCSKYSSSTKCLIELHWLLVKARIEFKIALIIYKCLKGNVPKYLKDLLVLNKLSGHNLRSHTPGLKVLIVPFVHNKTFAACSLSICGPKCWNHLPRNIHSISNVDDFKKG